MRLLALACFCILLIIYFTAGCTVVGFDTPYNKGVNAYRSGKYAKAAENFKIAIEKKKDFYEAWYNLALTYERLKKTDKAEQCYQQALKYSHNARVLVSYAMFRYEKGDTSAALMFLKQACEAEQDRAYPLVALGYYYQLEDQPKLALKYYNQAKEREPDYALTYYRLGMYYKQAGELEKAKKNLKQAVILDPEDAASAEEYGWVLVSLNLNSSAIQAFEKVIELEPDNLDIYLELARLYQTLGRHREAVDVLWQARYIAPDNKEISKLLIISYKALLTEELLGAKRTFTPAPIEKSSETPVPKK